MCFMSPLTLDNFGHGILDPGDNLVKILRIILSMFNIELLAHEAFWESFDSGNEESQADKKI